MFTEAVERVVGRSIVVRATTRIVNGALLAVVASAASNAQQALPNMDDITCYKPAQLCGGGPLGWAPGQAYAVGRAVCRLKIYAASAGVPEQLHGVCTGWLVNVAGRDDLVITSLHCVELAPGMFGPNVGPPPSPGSPGSCMPANCEPPRNPPPGGGPPWFVTRVECEFNLEYQGDCTCVNGAPPPFACNPFDPLHPCDTPEALEATCTNKMVWESTVWSDAGDGCDWVLLKLKPNAANQLPGTLFPELSLGVHGVPADLLMPQHPAGRCKEIAVGIAKGQYNGCDFAHTVEAQGGSSGSPLLYVVQGVPLVMGVLRGEIIAGVPPPGIVIGDGIAVDSARLIAGLGLALAVVDTLPPMDCVGGGGGGAIPTAGTGDGTWPGTLPSSPLVSALNVVVPAGSTTVVGVKLLGLTHTWLGDVHVVLEEPLGTKHTVMCRPGGGAASFGLSCDPAGDYLFVDGPYTGNQPYACSGASFPVGQYAQNFGAWPSGTAGIANTVLGNIPVANGVWKLYVYDWVASDVGALTGWELCFDQVAAVQVLPCQNQPTATQGCTSSPSTVGSPSASSASPFVITLAGLNAQVNGVVFYGINGTSSATWSSESLLCAKSPIQRLNGVVGAFGGTGGTSGLCDGSYSFDMNAVVQTPGSLGTPMSAGQAVVVQGWQRDAAAAKTTNLTHALSFVVGP